MVGSNLKCMTIILMMPLLSISMTLLIRRYFRYDLLIISSLLTEIASKRGVEMKNMDRIMTVSE